MACWTILFNSHLLINGAYVLVFGYGVYMDVGQYFCQLNRNLASLMVIDEQFISSKIYVLTKGLFLQDSGCNDSPTVGSGGCGERGAVVSVWQLCIRWPRPVWSSYRSCMSQYGCFRCCKRKRPYPVGPPHAAPVRLCLRCELNLVHTPKKLVNISIDYLSNINEK